MNKKYIESNVIEYKNIGKILGYNINVIGENEYSYYNKKFRYSNDNILWSDYKNLNAKNIQNIPISGDNLYIQYRFEQIGNNTLSVENISLDVKYKEEIVSAIPECHWSNVDNTSAAQIVYTNDGNNNLFNPYSVGNSYMYYNQLSSLVSNIFGFCVLYFKTEANSKSRDVVLKEYSIEHVIDKKNVKILIPDNQLPTKELQFNTMMIDYPVQFEVHIVKSEFKKIFGEDAHPDPHDYLYMQTYMNKMYMVDSVSEPDDFGYQGSYWRVSLVPYQELSSVKFDDENLLDDTESLIFSAEGKFEDEMKEEYSKSRKDEQLNDIGDWIEGQDRLRKYLNPSLIIRDENIYNDWTIISKTHYDLSTIDKDEIVNTYRYSTGFNSNDERMISFLIKPNNVDKNISGNIFIEKITQGKTGVTLKLKSWNNNILKGNYVTLYRTNFNDNYKIIKTNRTSLTIEIDKEYSENLKLFSCSKIIAFESNNVINIENENSYMNIYQINNKFMLSNNNNKFYYEFDNLKNIENKWYAVLLGIHNGLSNMWLYEIDGSDKIDNHHSKFKFIGKSTNDIGEFDLGERCSYNIIASNVNFTNFRLWSKLCEEDKHELILSQYVVDDTQNTLIIDNAQNELLLNNKWS